jgi:hypothetical protein
LHPFSGPAYDSTGYRTTFSLLITELLLFAPPLNTIGATMNLLNISLLFQNMSSDSEDDSWHDTYPKNTLLLLSPPGQLGVVVPMSTTTRLPHRVKSGKEVYVIYNDLTITYNGNR